MNERKEMRKGDRWTIVQFNLRSDIDALTAREEYRDVKEFDRNTSKHFS